MVLITKKMEFNAILARMARPRPSKLTFAYYQLEEDHTPLVLDLRMLDLKLINSAELILITPGKLLSHIFMPLVMLLKDKCLHTRLKKKVLLQLSIS